MSDEDQQRSPSPLVFTLLVTGALGYAAYLSPQRWSAAGLACVTASALIATPQLAEHLLLTATHPRAHRVARWGSTLFWILTRFGYALAALLAAALVLSAALGAVSGRDALLSVLILGALVAGAEILRRHLRGLVADVLSGGELDKSFYERHGEWRWLVAGGLFLAGTLLQLIGTFVD